MKNNKQKHSGSKPSNKTRSYESRVARDEIPKQMPMIQDQICYRQILRFVGTASFVALGSISVTFSNLLDAWLIATGATTCFALFDYVRVKKVTVRAMGGIPAGAAPQSNVAIEFPGSNIGFMGSGKQRQDSAIGFMEPAMVSLKPDKESQLAQFQERNDTAVAFIVRSYDQSANGLLGTTIDVEVVYRNSGALNASACQNPGVALTSGNLYFRGLDGKDNATTAMRSAFNPRA